MEKMIDVTYYQDAVLEIIVSGQHIAREVYELRLTLFVQAANCYFNRKHEVLEPFPSCFFDTASNSRRHDELQACVTSIQELRAINNDTSLPELSWELLLWIFTNPLKIKVVKESEISCYLTDELRIETKLMTIPYPSSNCNRFQITHPHEINSSKVFLAHKGKFGSFYAYHGSAGYNFHSIIHRGLRCSLNKRSAYGPGTYLTSSIETAKSYANQSVKFYGFDNLRNIAGIKFYVAIVEVIKHPSIKVVNPTEVTNAEPLNPPPNFDDISSGRLLYFVVNSDEFMRLKHLLVFY